MRERGRRTVLGLGLVGVVAALMLVIVGAATGYDSGKADDVQEGVADNPRCPAGTADAGSIKIESAQLVSGYNDGRISIPRRGGDPDSFDWVLLDHTVEVMAVIVKGGNLANIYLYDGSVTADEGLTPPLNGGEQNPQISHVEFCFDPKEGDTPPHLTVTKTATGTSKIQHNWAIDKQVKVAGSSDATYGDNASLNLPDGGNGSFTWKVTVTHTQQQTYAVAGTITIANDGDAAVTGVDVTDSLDGAQVSCGGSSTNLTVPGHGSIQCSYSVTPATQVANNTATATWGADGVASDEATITWASPTEVGVPASVEDGGQIDESLGLGDLEGNSWTDTYDERWTCSKGTPSPNSGRTNTATVTWDGGSDSDSASVQVGCGTTPPPPPPTPPVTPPTDEFMDVQVSKDATPQVQLVNGQAQIAYTIRVKNNGPNGASNVHLLDAAPGGVTFVSVTQQPVNGSCSINPALLNCSLGSLGPGVERVIGVSARVNQTGTYENCATAVGGGKDTNSANNRACASTLVTAPVTPPAPTPKPKPTKPKPKPKPVANVCRVLKVTPGMVKANGSKHVVVAKVTKSKTPVRGIKVRFTGVGLNKVVKTNKQGVARVGVTPSKAGIMVVRITNVKACNSARIGVVGVFEPPVTG
jgi:uncharacterized repeat protein (TIGR01451 family)